MNEIGFRRSHELSLAAEEFESTYERIEERALTAHAEGMVQMEAEKGVLDALHAQIEELLDRHNGGTVLLVENEQGRDYPKMHEKVTTLVIEGENKLYFHRTVDPPLRIGIYAPRQR